MCGIVGYLGNQGHGRSSWRACSGWSTAAVTAPELPSPTAPIISTSARRVGKVVGLVQEGPSKPPDGFAGIGDTRWATHGKPSGANAHPQTGCLEDIALVHNGIVENFLELKRRLQGEGQQFTSQTDEVICAQIFIGYEN